jgi:hypothetical protein
MLLIVPGVRLWFLYYNLCVFLFNNIKLSTIAPYKLLIVQLKLTVLELIQWTPKCGSTGFVVTRIVQLKFIAIIEYILAPLAYPQKKLIFEFPDLLIIQSAIRSGNVERGK